jgi:stage II sporulation protein AB (anti-sigma F factor)
MTLSFSAMSQNEAFARVAAAAFSAQLNPTVSEITDIKTAISEAVTNAIIHGYDNDAARTVHMKCQISGRTFRVEVWDDGKGIEDINRAREPMYTSKPEMERSGMGFTVMEEFMDGIEVTSAPGCGTRIAMSKTLA